MNSNYLEYIEIVNDEFGFEPENIKEDQIFNIVVDGEDIRKNIDSYADHSLKFFEDLFESKAPLMAYLVLYGYRVASDRLKNKNRPITRQKGTREELLWVTNLDAYLNKSNASASTNSSVNENQSSEDQLSVGNILEWCVNPKSNTETADTLYKKIFVNGLVQIKKRCQAKKVNLIVPPISIDLNIPNWENLLNALPLNDLEININNYGVFLNKDIDDYQYIVIDEKDITHSYTIVMVYKKERGQMISLGGLCFDNIEDNFYELHDTSYQKIVLLKNESTVIKPTEKKRVHKENFKLNNPHYEEVLGIQSFLSLHSETFYDDVFCRIHPLNDMFKDIFRYNNEIKIAEICCKELSEYNLNNIAVNDAVYIYNLIENNKNYKQNNLSTKSSYILKGTNQFDDDVIIDDIGNFPVNYGNIDWRLKNKNIETVSCYSLTSENTLDEMILSNLKYFKVANAGILAEEILFLLDEESNVNPSGFFVAKIYSKLCCMDEVEIYRSDDIIKDTFLTVRDETKIIVTKENKKKNQKKSSLQKVYLKDLGLQKETLNRLNNKRYYTVEDIFIKTNGNIKKLICLNKSCKRDLYNKLKNLNYKVTYQ